MNGFMIVIIEAAKWGNIISPIGWRGVSARCTQWCHQPPRNRKWNARQVSSYDKSKDEEKKKPSEAERRKDGTVVGS